MRLAEFLYLFIQMENTDTYIYAELYSRLRKPSLEKYFLGLKALISGAARLNNDFFVTDPALFVLIQNMTKSDFEKIEIQIRKSQESYRLAYLGHPDYPMEFLHLNEPAFLLRILGEPVWRTRKGFSVVGSREPSPLSLDWMEEHLSSAISRLNLFTISGGARGVDQKVHSLSLRKESPTVVLLPSGLGKIYPESLSYWTSMILEKGGALVSEYRDDQEMQKHHFLARNRLIAGLGIATLVIEARKKSGTLITARQAMEQGKPVLVLPSHPLDNKARGGLDLICEGATPIRDAEDLCVFLQSEILGSFTSPTPLGLGLKHSH